MRGQSHHRLGEYLAEHYMPHTKKTHIKAFLMGCVEPDRNPATYLKGSLRHQWLRGHNYRNARHFMIRISRRLERKARLNLLDYYALGKLIHYTADAFTYAHNADFPPHLSSHVEYESALQNYFLSYLAEDPTVEVRIGESIMDAFFRCRRDYERKEHSLRTDSRFALTACCCMLAAVFVKSPL